MLHSIEIFVFVFIGVTQLQSHIDGSELTTTRTIKVKKRLVLAERRKYQSVVKLAEQHNLTSKSTKGIFFIQQSYLN